MSSTPGPTSSGILRQSLTYIIVQVGLELTLTFTGLERTLAQAGLELCRIFLLQPLKGWKHSWRTNHVLLGHLFYMRACGWEDSVSTVFYISYVLV